MSHGFTFPICKRKEMHEMIVIYICKESCNQGNAVGLKT